jgi:hypothetical protein
MKYGCIAFVFLSILLDSCSNSMTINGMYGGKQTPHVFIFSADSTFKYEYHAMWYSESSGTWQKRKNTICLNSFEQRNKMPLEYTKIENDKNKAIINIKVDIADKPERDYICFPYVNGKSVFINPEKGSYSFDYESPADSIYFLIAKRPFILRGTGYKMSYDDIKTETIYPHLSVGESINITINLIDSLFGYKVFKDEKIEIKGGKMFFKEKNKKYKLFLKNKQ